MVGQFLCKAELAMHVSSTYASPLSAIIDSKMHFCFALRSINLTFVNVYGHWLDRLSQSFTTFMVTFAAVPSAALMIKTVILITILPSLGVITWIL